MNTDPCAAAMLAAAAEPTAGPASPPATDRLSSNPGSHVLCPGARERVDQLPRRTLGQLMERAERFIAARVIERSVRHGLGDRAAMEALLRYIAAEIRRQDGPDAPARPSPQDFAAGPDAVSEAALGAREWAVLALTCLFERVVPRPSGPRRGPEQAVIGELEWVYLNQRTDEADRSAALDDLIGLVGTLDRLLQRQAQLDRDAFVRDAGMGLDEARCLALAADLLRTYRRRFLVDGLRHPRFEAVLREMLSPEQQARLDAALRPLFTGLA